MRTTAITAYFKKIEADNRLTVWHTALLFTLLSMAFEQGHFCCIKASRRKIMSLSHIATLPTYHKYFKDLQRMGYIDYRPSYHPQGRSEIDLKKQPCH